MAQKHSIDYTEYPMTRDGRIQGPSRRYRRLRHPIFPAATWTAKNPLLQRGEIGAESDTYRMKIGDGVTYWNDLPYSSDSITTWGDIQGDIADQTDLQNALDAKQDVLTAGSNIQIDSDNVISATDTTYTASDGVTLTGTNFTNSGVRAVASGTTNGTISVNTNGTSADVAVTGLGSAAYTSSSDYATAAQGAKADTAVQPGDLATVATTGSYNDLLNKPTIPAAQVNSDWDAVSGVAQILNKPTLATVATSGDYDDLLNKPTIPTVNNATLTIQKNGTTVNTFTANASSNVTANITVPTKISDLTNDSNFANTDLSNLTSTGKNIGNWSTNATNCITEIPQDIKLTLSNGTLTLAAGSKFYYPNGSGSFGTYTLANNMVLTLTNYGTQSNIMLFVNAAKTGLSVEGRAKCYSGSTAPTGFTGYAMWYDTANNQIKRTTDGGSTWTSGVSFPIATITSTSNVVTSIDQVFNGFGYIGSTIFALPGVKGLIPNGRNTDGTLNNRNLNTTSVLTYTNTSTFDRRNILIRNSDIVPTSVYLDVEGNRNRRTDNGNIVAYVDAGIISATTGSVITSFSPKYAFRAVDYNDYQKTVSQVDTNTANIALKQDEATAVNYDNITNCITEIPQNINLTLSDGKLTLKAGSKVYVPNGVGVFNVVSITTDRTVTNTSNGQKVIYTNATGTSVSVLDISGFSSGSTMPSGTWKIWYDTTNNLVKKIEGTAGVVAYNCAFPLGVVTVSNGAISSIDKVFNGIGYIGSTVFVLPGVKGLIPNGRNADGTLKNTSFTTSSVLTNTITSTLSSLNNIRITGTVLQIGSLVYDEIYNYNRLTSSGDIRAFATAGYVRTDSGGKITSFSTKYAFHSVDYSDSEYIANCAMPSARYIDLTLGATQSNYTAPADGYVTFSKVSATANQVVVLSNTTAGGIGNTAFSIEGNQWLRASIPVSKGDVFTAEYSATGATKAFRFVYANGSK